MYKDIPYYIRKSLTRVQRLIILSPSNETNNNPLLWPARDAGHEAACLCIPAVSTESDFKEVLAKMIAAVLIANMV